MRKRHVTNPLKGALLIGIVGAVAWGIAGLPGTFDPNEQPVGHVGQPAVSAFSVYTGVVAADRTRLYAIDYDSQKWSGNLHSFPIEASGAIVKTDDWGVGGAAAKIDTQSASSATATSPPARKIVTRNDASPPANVQFRWKTEGDADKKLLSRISDTQKLLLNNNEKMLKYLRGERGEDGGDFRDRATVLGDIIHSTPIYCPATLCTAATVFVGANDAMLHAIDPATGYERFAYIPSMLFPALSSLTVDPYVHKYTVDGRMDLRRIGSQTILVGGLGAGGKGLYALDVTNAAPLYESDAITKILWEITNTGDFLNLGYTYGQPVLATLAGGLNALVVGNGYANSNNFKASLFIIDPLTGARLQELITTDDTPTTTNRNGLSSPTLVDDEGDGKMDSAYAGDLNGNLWKFKLSSPWTVTKVFTTSPPQPITMQPGAVRHPKGGWMLTFITGRMLTPDDATDNATHAAYGIWDGAPAGNTTLVDQTLTERSYQAATPAIRVRTATNNVPDWNDGGNKGWRTELPIGGERVVGDGARISDNVFQFMSTNPTIESDPGFADGENWWMQLNAYTGGDIGSVRFDLNNSGTFTSADQVSVSDALTSPVGRHMGPGRRSQFTAYRAASYTVYQSNYDKNIGAPPVADSGVSGGHFDYDIYYWGGSLPVYSASGLNETRGPFCLKTTDVNNYDQELAPNYCKTGSPYLFKSGYGFLMTIDTGAKCGDPKQATYLQTLTCSQYVISDTGGTSYDKRLHVHEYDDKYNVTGVNNLHPSDQEFKINAMKPLVDNPNLEFKILVLGQFMSPAALLRVGTEAQRLAGTTAEVSVKTYGNLASETDPATLLNGLATYTIAAGSNQLGAFVYNLPKTAFQSKDWWGSGGDGQARAGLIPTQTGCVNGVRGNGESEMLGPQGERFNGALGFQVVKATTPPEALEMNRTGDVRYGWRIKQSYIFQYLIGEYSTFWHHFNGKCWSLTNGWVQNPPQDEPTSAQAETGDPGADDPKGLFGGPGTPGDATVVSVVTMKDSSGVTMTRTTYSNGTTVDEYADGHTVTTTYNPDGSIKSRTVTVPGMDTGGAVNPADATNSADRRGALGPLPPTGRINWRELRR